MGCPPGTYSPTNASAICLACPAGQYSLYNSSSCTVCPAGQYNSISVGAAVRAHGLLTRTGRLMSGLENM